MNSEKAKAFVQLSRPLNVLITFVSIPVACWISGGTGSEWILFVLAAATGALVTAGANALNDAFDIEIDRVNRPGRPLPRGVLTESEARIFWLVTSAAAIVINAWTNGASLLIASLAVAALSWYSARLKRTVLAGNFVVAVITGMAFLYGGAVVGHMERALVPALFAFLVNLARELVKDVEDLEGDRRNRAATLPVRHGARPALLVASASLVLLVAATLFASRYAGYNSLFLYIVLIADVSMLSTVVMMWKNSSRLQMGRVSLILKFSMMIGLVSIVAGSV